MELNNKFHLVQKLKQKSDPSKKNRKKFVKKNRIRPTRRLLLAAGGTPALATSFLRPGTRRPLDAALLISLPPATWICCSERGRRREAGGARVRWLGERGRGWESGGARSGDGGASILAAAAAALSCKRGRGKVRSGEMQERRRGEERGREEGRGASGSGREEGGR